MTMMGMPTSFPTVSRSFSGNVQPNGDKDNISAEFQAFTERLNRRVQTSLQHNAFKPKPLQHYPGTAGISAQIVTRESACASSLHIRSRKSVKRTKQDLSASMERLASPGLQIRPATSDGGSDQGASLQLFSPIRSQKEGGFGFDFDPSTYDVTEAEEIATTKSPLSALTAQRPWSAQRACSPQRLTPLELPECFGQVPLAEESYFHYSNAEGTLADRIARSKQQQQTATKRLVVTPKHWGQVWFGNSIRPVSTLVG
jgi:hypothetical protein